MPRMKLKTVVPIPLEEGTPVPQLPFTRHSHTTSTSNFNPKVSLGNARIHLHQMNSSLPILSAQVRHALSNNPLYER